MKKKMCIKKNHVKHVLQLTKDNNSISSHKHTQIEIVLLKVENKIPKKSSLHYFIITSFMCDLPYENDVKIKMIHIFIRYCQLLSQHTQRLNKNKLK